MGYWPNKFISFVLTKINSLYQRYVLKFNLFLFTGTVAIPFLGPELHWNSCSNQSRVVQEFISRISDQKAPPPPPSPISENFRFEMTKVYSRIPPSPSSENAWDRMWRLICNPQAYQSLIAVIPPYVTNIIDTLVVPFTRNSLQQSGINIDLFINFNTGVRIT